jgi:hypothetical protein
MRTTVDIDAHLLQRLRAEAHRRAVSFKALLNGVLHRGLDERRAGGAKRYRCPTFGMGAPRRPLDKALAIADAFEAEEIARELTLRE